MKKLFYTIIVLACSMANYAQTDTIDNHKDTTGFIFTTVKDIPITSVKDQHRSGTCWAFSTLSFLEAELLRTGKGEYDLSEMFVVHHTMRDRAQYCVRMYGDVKFAAGGSAYDIIYCLKHYGLVPQSAMPGIMYNDSLPNHGELDDVVSGFLTGLWKSSRKKLTPVWQNALTAIYDTYLGQCPQQFEYEGKTYTPISFANELGLNPDDYVSITSYTHHPFYTQFPLEVPDNWRMDQMYNVPIDELMEIIDNAINNGYTLAWGADVSEVGFTRNGIAVMPDADKGAEITGTDMAKWTGLSQAEKKQELTAKPLPELEITQEMRQLAFDNWENTDDHGMHIFGTATDQNGKLYYKVKNSWGTTKSKYNGIWYVSTAFMKYKTNDILVHKDAIPKHIRKKLGIK